MSPIQDYFYFPPGNMQEHVIKSRRDEVWNSLDEKTRETYGQDYLYSTYSHILASAQRYPADLTPVTRCMRSGLLSKRPRERYPCGTGADIMLNIYPLLPVWVADKVSRAIGIFPRTILPTGLQEWVDTSHTSATFVVICFSTYQYLLKLPFMKC